MTSGPTVWPLVSSCWIAELEAELRGFGSWIRGGEGPVRHQVRRAAGAGVVAGYLILQGLGRGFGATKEERRQCLPGDDLMGGAMAVTTHAITIDAPPERIWPWLLQLGWHRGAWYTAEWVDRLLFPANASSAGHILPEF